jgi:hypothetical protein
LDASLPNTLNAITAIQPGKGPTYRQAGEDAYFAGMEPGQRLRATVRSNLSNGDFVVMLGAFAGKDGQEVQMKLPSGFRPGDALNLIFLSREPRPTFRLPVEIAPAAAYSSLLSGTGRFIHDLMQGPTVPSTPAALSSTTPLLTVPPADAARLLQLAQGLARVVAQSGLFYESHLAQWAAGKRTTAELMLEPQARLSPPPPLPNLDADAAAPPEARRDGASPQDQARPAPVHPEALALVRQQLEIYETRHVGWQGEVWPGQHLDWEAVEEKPEESSAREPASGHAWKTRLYLSLPNLGPVTASLRLDSGRVEVQLTVKDSETASIMRTGAAPLLHGLASAGLKLTSMGVDVDDEARSA